MTQAFNRHRREVIITAIVAACLVLADSPSAEVPREHKDLVFATVDGKSLSLDLYLPADVKAPALLVWVHGGAWATGTKANVPTGLVQSGMAVASVDFR